MTSPAHIRLPSRQAALLALAALALGACGSDDDDGAQGTEPGVPTQTQAATTATTPRAPTGPPRLVEIGSFDMPAYVTSPPGEPNRLFVVEQGGTIRIVEDGETLPEPFLDISDQTEAVGEQGLFSIAFAPDFARSGRFYVDYTDNAGDTQVVEYRASLRDPDRAVPGSARTLLSVDQPEANHNGGQLVFGPDGLLYIGLGDGGGAGDAHGDPGNGQDTTTLLGSILRIDPTPGGDNPYTIPPDNPFAPPGGGEGEIYVYGVRNPWRFSFDRATGDLVIGDVGQDAVEEIDFLPAGTAAGANLGWRAYEGSATFDSSVDPGGTIGPVLEYGREGGCSVTGGYVVRDPRLPALAGRYVYGDFCQGELRAAILDADGARDDRSLGLNVSSLSSFGEDAAGRVYAVSLEGPVYRLVATP